MRALQLNKVGKLKKGEERLEAVTLSRPEPADNEILIRISVCGVCHTELDEIEGRTSPQALPVIPGHQVVGYVEGMGKGASIFKKGDRVGVGWIYSACGRCDFCLGGNENLCRHFMATGRDANGGYAEYMVVPEEFVYSIPVIFSDAEAAPLLCAGSIGYRSLRLTGMKDGQSLGLTGFGASAHLVLKMARHRFPRSAIYVFARSEKERAFAKELGAVWAGDTIEEAPEPLNCIIDTTPVWTPVVEALKNMAAGGRLVINAIRKDDVDKESLLTLDYSSQLWMEKEIKSVANVSRSDVIEFLQLAADMHIKPEIQEYPLESANKALAELKAGRIRGAKVLRI